MAAFPLIPVLYLQIYVLTSLLILVAAFAYDFVFDKKLEFMRRQRRSLEASEAKGSIFSALAKAILIDIASSYPLGKCSPARRASHLLTLWGFIIIVLSILVSSTGLAGKFYVSPSNPFMISQLVGNLSLIVGTLWYLPQRVNVRFEGNSTFSLNYSDAFIINLIAISAFDIAAYLFSALSLAFLSQVTIYAYFLLITLMFALTHWTKFPHSFYKAGLFILDRIDEEKGISNLPKPVETKAER
ncbi:MAG: hypothetical protein QXX17_00330 [Conexivisphaerales archaeon]